MGTFKIVTHLAFKFGMVQLLVIAIVSMTVVRVSTLLDRLAAAPAGAAHHDRFETVSSLVLTLGTALLLCGWIARWVLRFLP